jgi:hypothetical protein
MKQLLGLLLISVFAIGFVASMTKFVRHNLYRWRAALPTTSADQFPYAVLWLVFSWLALSSSLLTVKAILASHIGVLLVLVVNSLTLIVSFECIAAVKCGWITGKGYSSFSVAWKREESPINFWLFIIFVGIIIPALISLFSTYLVFCLGLIDNVQKSRKRLINA